MTMSSWRAIRQQWELENDGTHIPYDKSYWTAQVCLNGHVLHGGCEVIPTDKFCGICSAATIYQCPTCKHNIKGAFRTSSWLTHPGVLYCSKCGTSFPWTHSAIATMNRLVDESSLGTHDREEIKTSLETVLRNTPAAPVAAHRIHHLLVKAGEACRTGYEAVIVPLIAKTLAEIIKAG